MGKRISFYGGPLDGGSMDLAHDEWEYTLDVPPGVYRPKDSIGTLTRKWSWEPKQRIGG